MKHISFLISFFFLGFCADAQIINIPDANFKNVLVNTNCAILTSNGTSYNSDVDTNNDGEIQETEAAAIYKLQVTPSGVSSLEGITYFTNLTTLVCNGNNLTSVDLSSLSALLYVQMGDDALTSISFNPAVVSVSLNTNQFTSTDFVNGLTNLTWLDIGYNSLATADFSGCQNLDNLDCSFNQLTSLDLSANHLHNLTCNDNLLTNLVLCPEVTALICNNNQLSTLDMSMIDAMYILNVTDNQLTSLVVPPPVSDNSEYYLNMSGNLYTSVILPEGIAFSEFVCDHTQLTSLKLPSFNFGSAETYSVSNNLNLQYIDAKDTNICIPTPPWESWDCLATIVNNPQLQFICVSDSQSDANDVFQYFRDHNNPEMSFSSYCTFTPGGNYNTIAGNIKLDLDSNGCDVSDIPVANVQLGITLGANPNPVGETFTNALGNYTVYTNYLHATITPHFENPYFSILPASFTSSFTGAGNTETANFCITPNGVHPDLKITLIPLDVARPGFNASYKIHYENKGTEIQTGIISLAFQDDVTDLVSANPAVSTQAANSLEWDFSNLAPFESHEITFTLNVNSPLEIPPVNIGDHLDFSALVIAGSDETPNDNTFAYNQTVVGSFDPNDKAVSRENIGVTQLDDYLYYIVRFQNTGTFYAENVVVKDLLSASLDLTTLQMVSASHNYRSTLTSNNKLEFFFEGINLPASSVDEPGSHGYVTFKIKPKNTLVIGNAIENSAGIYFDFNAPIVTNTVTTTIAALATNDYSVNNFSLYPNPVKNILTIDLKDNFKMKSIAIYNTLGQLVKNLPIQFENRSMTADISGLESGTYFVQVISDKGKTTKKLVKL